MKYYRYEKKTRLCKQKRNRQQPCCVASEFKQIIHLSLLSDDHTHIHTFTPNVLVACWLCLHQPELGAIKHGRCQPTGQPCTSVCPINTDVARVEMLNRGPPPLESLERFGWWARVWHHVFTFYRADCILSDSEDDPLWPGPGPSEINIGMAKCHKSDLNCYDEQTSL